MAQSKDPFTVHLDDNLIVVTRFGVQSAASVAAIHERVAQLIEADPTRRNVLVIVKVTSIPDGPSNAESIRSLNELPYDKVAVVSSAHQRLAIAKKITQASEAGDKVRLFRNEEDARAWLAE